MIKTPYIFSQIEGQSFPANAFLGSQSPFEISPKTLQTIYVIVFARGIFTFAVFYQTMDIPPAEICGGEPCTKRSCIPVHIILSHLAAGEDYETTLKNFPRVTREDRP